MRAFRVGLFTCLLLAQTAWAEDQNPFHTPDPHAAFRQHVERYTTAFNQKNLPELAALWAADGEYYNLQSHQKVSGREAITDSYQAFLAEYPDARLVAQLNSVKQVTEDVARGEGTSQLLLADGTTQAAAFVVLYVKQGDHWVLDSLTETELPPLTATAALAELEWLVGDWEDDTAEVLVQTSCKWSRTQAFLLRKFVVHHDDQEEATEGTQIIGWDPLYHQIRSWTFYSDGSFGSGFWSKNGDNWLVKGTQTLADGRVADGLHVISHITADSMQVQLTSYSIEGELQPSREPVTVVRVHPAVEENSTPEGVQE